MKKLILLAVVLSLSFVNAQTGVKGLAMADPSHQEDLSLLSVSWWYTWGWNTSPGAVPMVRSMQNPMSCASIILVGNEPNAKEPNGAPISPQDAVIRVKSIQSQCPNSKLIVGNVAADDWSVVGGWGSGYNWLRSFLRSYPKYTGAFGVHCYTYDTASWCVSKLKQMRSLYRGEMWMTEGNCLNCSTTEFTKLVAYASTAFARYALYTNRQSPDAYAQGWALAGADLVNQDGTLTPNGSVYANLH